MSRSLVLAAIGLALAGVSLIGFLSTRIDTGDLDLVESLGDGEATTTTSTAESSTETGPGQSPQREPDALWTANSNARLDALKPPTQPTTLSIPSLGVDAPIGAYGLDDRGRMDVPSNVEEVGWYKYGATPGSEGSAVLAAHVDLRNQGPGVFFELKTLSPGATIEVGYEDGTSARFTVVARRSYLKEELPLEAIFARTGSPILTLVTCGGGFSESNRSYDSNVVVFAVPDEARSDSGAAS